MFRDGYHDLSSGLRDWRFWWAYGLIDARRRYLRTRFGVAWEIIGPALFVYSIGFAYTRLFGYNLSQFLPHIAIGYVIWLNMQIIVSEGCGIIINAQGILLSNPRPISSFVYKNFVSAIFYSSVHSIILVPVLFFYFPVFFNANIFFLVYFVFLYLLAAVSLFLILSLLCLRFRDLHPLIIAINRLAFFVTPIIWIEQDLGELGKLILSINPYTYYLDGIRAALIGGNVTGLDMLVTFGITLCLMSLAIMLLGTFKPRIAYWL